ncbi:uncharacterized protein LOC143024172 [Oratosquilla oratoria]|uniref:uncharacterized protein LOC143024172 n=1 Tax=Oratosquilla oratoria TaxID=337810 RepID=UPI003F76D76C
MAVYGAVNERCRFCGMELPVDSVSVMSHLNSHRLQYNLEFSSLSPCAFEPQLDIRVGETPLNDEDLEVSSHMDASFHYAYSPQTEPSNLTITGARCSPLNLTGRPNKHPSPLASPPPQPPPPPPSAIPQAPSVIPHSPMVLNHAPHTFPLGSLMPPHHHHNHLHHPHAHPHQQQQLQQQHQHHPMSPPQIITPVSGMPNMIPQQELIGSSKRKRKPERFYSRPIYGKCIEEDEAMKGGHHALNMAIPTLDMSHNPNLMASCQSVNKLYRCSICDSEFNFKEELLKHSESHEAAKPYKCDICGAGLSHVSALRRHKLTHSGYKPHRCEQCGRSFYQKCDLQRHSATHGKTKRFECNICKKKYSSLHFLENHKCKPPEDPKPFKCNLCGEGCSNNMAWSYHMWKHTKNPIFVPCQETCP